MAAPASLCARCQRAGFGCRPPPLGLSCTLNAYWLFKYDFTMTCWFRAESFVPGGNSWGDGGGVPDPVVLFSAATRNRTLIAVTLQELILLPRSIGSINSTTMPPPDRARDCLGRPPTHPRPSLRPRAAPDHGRDGAGPRLRPQRPGDGR